MHTIGIAAILHLRSDKVAGGYIGMDFTFDEEFEVGPWGNSALMSRHFSSADFPVVPTGGELSRVGKLHSLIQSGEDGYLTVCNNSKRSLKNCGSCEKCQRTMLAYRSLGIEPADGLFEHALELEAVRKLKISKLTQWVFYVRMAARWANKEDPYYEIVRNMVATAKEEGFTVHHEKMLSENAEATGFSSGGWKKKPPSGGRSIVGRVLRKFGMG